MQLRTLMTGLVLSGLMASLAYAQPKAETKTGTVKEIVTKGRSTTLVITDAEGTDLEFLLTPKVIFEVQGKGDAGFLTAGQLVKGKGVLTNERLIVSEVSIYLLGPGKKAPAGKIAKSPPVPGESQNSYDFFGEILGVKQDEDFPDYQQLGVKIAGRLPSIVLEKDFGVTVVSPSPEQAEAGMPVEFDVVPLRGGKMNLLKAIVTNEEGFKSEELLKAPAGR